MRPTAPTHSGMPTGKAYIGWWGDMGGPKQKGIVTYGMSPFRQRATAGMLRGYLFNGFRRIMVQTPYFVVPFATGYGVYTWGKNRYEWNNSKEGHHILSQQEHGH